MQPRAIRFSDKALKDIEPASREHGFVSWSAFVRYAVGVLLVTPRIFDRRARPVPYTTEAVADLNDAGGQRRTALDRTRDTGE